jgi:crotonobetainyl-CoA:carnitine CoA-transferase CaiB-like acyl-CoA transferase
MRQTWAGCIRKKRTFYKKGDAMTSGNDELPLLLEGIRELDATHIVAGPFCSMILADMGAEVIKIERPRTGDLSRGRGPFIRGQDGQQVSSRYLGVNRNKKSVTLDLRHPRCKAAFENLVRASDVLLDNWGPGAFSRLGLGYERLRELNPGLVYATITGYGDSDGRRGPYSNWPANNLSIQGMAGWMEITGDPDGRLRASEIISAILCLEYGLLWALCWPWRLDVRAGWASMWTWRCTSVWYPKTTRQ